MALSGLGVGEGPVMGVEGEKRGGLAERIKTRLSREMFGGKVGELERKAEVEKWAEVDKVRQLRADLKAAGGDMDKYREVAEKSFLVAEYREVRDRRLGYREVADVVAVNNVLRERPEMVAEMAEGLISAQVEMMRAMGVSEAKIKSGEAHIRGVMDLVGKKGTDGSEQFPLAKIAAAVHDMVKYVGVPEGNLLAEHEMLLLAQEKALRAVFEEVRKQPGMRELVSENAVRSSITLLLKVNAVHGEGEWPRLQTEKIGRIITLPDGMKAGDLFGGLHVFAASWEEMPVVLEKEEKMLTDDQRAFVREMKGSVSAADKTEGIFPRSFLKYLVESAPGSEFEVGFGENKRQAKFTERIYALYDSFAPNIKNSPLVGSFDTDKREEGKYMSTLMLIALMDQADPDEDWRVRELRSGNSAGLFEKLTAKSRPDGSELGKRMVAKAKEVRTAYDARDSQGFRTAFAGLVEEFDTMRTPWEGIGSRWSNKDEVLMAGTDDRILPSRVKRVIDWDVLHCTSVEEFNRRGKTTG